MKQVLIILLLFLQDTVFAQSFTEPDSAAIIKNHVKQVTISWTNDKGNVFPSHTFRYDQKGQMIYSSEGNPSYYYSFRYDSAGRMCWSDQRKMNGDLIAGYGFIHYPDGKTRYMSYYSEYDTVHANMINEMDIAGNIIETRYFRNGILQQLLLRRYDGKTPVWSYDSSATEIVIRNGNRIERWSTVDTTLHRKTNWYFQYDSAGKLICTLEQYPAHSNKTEIRYIANGLYLLTINGTAATPEQDRLWRSKWDFLIPKKIWPEDRLPYSDPVPEEKWNHQLVKNKKGDIIKDIITPGYEWMPKETSVYLYEYEYWK